MVDQRDQTCLLRILGEAYPLLYTRRSDRKRQVEYDVPKLWEKINPEIFQTGEYRNALDSVPVFSASCHSEEFGWDVAVTQSFARGQIPL